MFALMKKESLQVVRDPSSILIAFVLPLILLFIFGFGMSLDPKNMRIGLVLDDRGPEAASLAFSLYSTPYFKVSHFDSRAQATAALAAGRIRGYLVLAEDFTRSLQQAGDRPQIQIVTDGSETNTAIFLANFAQGVIATWSEQYATTQGLTMPPGIELVPRFYYNEELDSRDTLIPGSLVMIMAIIGTLLTALVVAREWERGTMESLLATPLNAFEITFGKLFPYFVLGIGSMTVCVLCSIFVFEVPFRGSLTALYLSSGAFLLASLGLGFLISTLCKNQFLAAQGALIIAFLPSFILSGVVFEIASMPWPIRILTHLFPARYFVTNLRTTFLVGDVWELLIPNILYMLLFAVVFFGISIAKMPRRLE